MQMNRCVFLLALLSLATGPRAEAQSCAFLSPGAPPQGTVDDSVALEAMNAAAAAMSDAGLAVLRHDDVQTRLLTDPNRGCNEIDCGSQVAATLGVDVTVLVTVWARDGNPTSVVVTLVDQEGESYGGDTEVTGGDVAAAARTAAATAHGGWDAAQMGRLIVNTVPEGALIEVDDREVGRSPVTRLVPAGIRRVRATLDSRSAAREVQVTALEDNEVTIELGSGTAPAGGYDPTGHLVGSVVLGVAGLSALGIGIGFAVSACEATLTDGRCAVWSATNEAVGIALSVVGGAMFAGGIGWLIAGLGMGGSGGAVEAVIGPGSLQLRGRF